MRGFKIPNVIRSKTDHSITLACSQPRFTLIWLHGLGGDTESFVSFFTHSSSPLYRGLRIKLIQAPTRSVTINGGEQCASWYDLRSMKRFTEPEENVFNLAQLDESSKILGAYFSAEIEKYVKTDPDHPVAPNHRIFMGGFSQGGVVALHHSLTSDIIAAGVIATSSYLLKYTSLKNLQQIPMCLMHG